MLIVLACVCLCVFCDFIFLSAIGGLVICDCGILWSSSTTVLQLLPVLCC